MTPGELPHFQRLAGRLRSCDAPLVVLWAWPGSGARRFLAWFAAQQGAAAVALRPVDVSSSRFSEILAEHEEVRHILVDGVNPSEWLRLTRHLLPSQSLVVTAYRSEIPDGVRSAVLGPSEFLLLRDEASGVEPDLPETELDPIFSRTSGWLRPLQILAAAGRGTDSVSQERAELGLETFLDTEVLGPLEIEMRTLVSRLLTGRSVPEDVLSVGDVEENPVLDQLRFKYGFVDAAARSLLPPLLYGRHFYLEPVMTLELDPDTFGSDSLSFDRLEVLPEKGLRSLHTFEVDLDSGILSNHEGGGKSTSSEVAMGGFDGFAISLLGIPLVERRLDELRNPVPWKLRRALHMLAFLCTRPGLAAGRDEVVDALWPDDGDDTVNRNLHPTVSILRRALRLKGRENPVLLRNGVYRLSPEVDWQIDAVDFERAVLTGRPTEGSEPVGPDVVAWEEAWRLYRGPFLQGHQGGWISRRGEELQRLYLDMLRGLGDAYMKEGRSTAAEDAYRSVLNVDPVQESVHLAIMTIYAKRGRRDLVRKQYERLCGLLQEELGVEPMPSTSADYHRLMS